MGSTTKMSERFQLRPSTAARRLASELRLQRWEELTLQDNERLARLLDRLQRRFSQLSLPLGVLEPRDSSILAATEFYRANAFHLSPEHFYQLPAEEPRVHVQGSRPLSDGEVSTLSFQSGFEPVYPGYRETFERMPHNRLVRTRAWRHPQGRSKGTLIAIHGWQMEDQGVSAVALAPGFFFRLGLNVLLYELPYHGPRRLRSEGAFPSLHTARTNEGFAQAIYELRQLKLLLHSMGETSIAVLGLSLGGYTAALWAALDELDCVICTSPLADIISFAEYFLLHGAEPSALPTLGIVRARLFEEESVKMLRDAFAVHSPLSYATRLPAERRLLLAADSDEIVPLGQLAMLQKHWRDSKTVWLPGGHFGQLYTREARAAVHSFLNTLGLAYDEALEVQPPAVAA